jgi:hypothetical protein
MQMTSAPEATETQTPQTQPLPNAACKLDEHHSRFCPTCSSRLEDSRCKLICRTCGYFLSCADFY